MSIFLKFKSVKKLDFGADSAIKYEIKEMKNIF